MCVKDSRSALHETCRSQSDAEQDLRNIAQLLIDAGAELDSKAVDAGEVRPSVCLSHRSVVGTLLDSKAVYDHLSHGWHNIYIGDIYLIFPSVNIFDIFHTFNVTVLDEVPN